MADTDAPSTYRKVVNPLDKPGKTPLPTPTMSTPVVPQASPHPDAPSTYRRVPTSDQALGPRAEPDPNAYKPPDWIPGAGYLDKATRVFQDAVTAHLADWATGRTGEWMREHGVANTTPSVPQLRAQTAQERKDIGPVMSTVADTAGYMMGPGKILGGVGGAAAPQIGRYGSAILEGTLAGGVDSAGRQVGGDRPFNYADVGKESFKGALAGLGGQAAGDAISAVARPVIDRIKGLPGRSSEAWDYRTRAAGSPADVEGLRTEIAGQHALNPTPQSADALTALGQSTEPGRGANIVKTLGTIGGGAAGLEHGMDAVNGVIGAVSGGGLGTVLADPFARRINQVDKNINVGHALDRLYPTWSGSQSTTDTSRWADLIRQGVIGEQLQ